MLFLTMRQKWGCTVLKRCSSCLFLLVVLLLLHSSEAIITESPALQGKAPEGTVSTDLSQLSLTLTFDETVTLDQGQNPTCVGTIQEPQGTETDRKFNQLAGKAEGQVITYSNIGELITAFDAKQSSLLSAGKSYNLLFNGCVRGSPSNNYWTGLFAGQWTLLARQAIGASFTPRSGALVTPPTEVSIGFSEAVVYYGSCNATVYTPIVQLFDLSGLESKQRQITVSSASGQVSGAGSKTISMVVPATPLLSGTGYYITVCTHCFYSSDCVLNYKGFSDSTTWRFSTSGTGTSVKFLSTTPANSASIEFTGSSNRLTHSFTFNQNVYPSADMSLNIYDDTLQSSSPAFTVSMSSVSFTASSFTTDLARFTQTVLANRRYRVEVPQNMFLDSTQRISGPGNPALTLVYTTTFGTAPAPTVKALSPADETYNVSSLTTKLVITFSQAVLLNTSVSNPVTVVDLTGNTATQFPTSITVSSVTPTAVITIAATSGSAYDISVKEGTFRSLLGANTSAITGWNFYVEGGTSPVLLSTVPNHLQSNVSAPLTTITLSFDQRVGPGTGSVGLLRVGNINPTFFNLSTTATGFNTTTLVVTLPTPLYGNDNYTLSLSSTAVVSLSGVSGPTTGTTSITWAMAITPPRLVSFSPGIVAGGTSTSITQASMSFDLGMTKGTAGQVDIVDLTGRDVNRTIPLSMISFTRTFGTIYVGGVVPAFVNDRVFAVVASSGMATGSNGLPWLGISDYFTWNWITPSPTAATLINSTHPEGANVSVLGTVTVTLQFDQTMVAGNGVTTNATKWDLLVRSICNSNGNTGSNPIGSLTDLSGLSAVQSLRGDSVQGFGSRSLSFPVTLEAGRAYYLSLNYGWAQTLRCQNTWQTFRFATTGGSPPSATAFYPTNGSAVNTDAWNYAYPQLRITFSENIVLTAGGGLYLTDHSCLSSNKTVFLPYSGLRAGNDALSLGASGNFTDNVLLIAVYGVTWGPGRRYSLTASPGLVKNTVGHPWVGLTQPMEWSFTTFSYPTGQCRYNQATETTYAWLKPTVEALVPAGGFDDAVSLIPIGFDVRMGCDAYTNVYVQSNGFLAFVSRTQVSGQGECEGTCPTVTETSEYNNCCWNEMIPLNLTQVAVLWDDWSPQTSGNITYGTVGTAPNRRFVVSYNSVNAYGTSNSSTQATFQVVFFEAEGTSSGSILMQYETVSMTHASALGASAVVGVNSPQGDTIYSYRNASLRDAMALLFTPLSASVPAPITSVPLTVNATTPVSGATGLAPSSVTSVTVFFSQCVARGSTGSITVHDLTGLSSNLVFAHTSDKLAFTDNALVLSLGAVPQNGRRYNITFDAGVAVSSVGTASPALFVQFSTSGGVSPTLVSSVPANGSTAVNASTLQSLSFTFSENIYQGTGTGVQIQDLTGLDTALSISISNASGWGSRVIVFPLLTTVSLKNDRAYRINADTGVFVTAVNVQYFQSGLCNDVTCIMLDFTTSAGTGPVMRSSSPIARFGSTSTAITQAVMNFDRGVSVATGTLTLVDLTGRDANRTLSESALVVTTDQQAIPSIAVADLRSLASPIVAGRVFAVLATSGVLRSTHVLTPWTGISCLFTWNFYTSGGTAPVLQSSTPAQNAVNVNAASTTSVVWQFDQTVVAGRNVSSSISSYDLLTHVVCNPEGDAGPAPNITAGVSSPIVLITDLSGVTAQRTILADTVQGFGSKTLTVPATFADGRGYRVSLVSRAIRSLSCVEATDASVSFITSGGSVPEPSTFEPPTAAVRTDYVSSFVLTFGEIVHLNSSSAGVAATLIDESCLSDPITITVASDMSLAAANGVPNSSVVFSWPVEVWAAGRRFHVLFGSAVISNSAGISWGGLTNASEWYFSTSGAVPLTLAGTVPANGATGLNSSTIGQVNVTFSECIRRGSAGTVIIRDDTGIAVDQVLSASASQLEFTQRTLVVTPGAIWTAGRRYTVIVGSGVVLNSVGAAASAVSFSFSTAGGVAPTLVTTAPVHEASAVDANATVTLTLSFSQNIWSNNGSVCSFQLQDLTGQGDSTFTVDPSLNNTQGSGTKTIVVYIPTSSALQTGRIYSVIIGSSCFSSAASLSFTQTQPWQFTTSGAVAPVLQSLSPPHNSTDLSADAVSSLVLSFRENVRVSAGVLTLKDLTLRLENQHIAMSANNSNIVVTNISVGASPFSSVSISGVAVSPGYKYCVTLPSDAIVSLTNTPFSGIACTDWTFSMSGGDAPTVVTTAPANGAADVAAALITQLQAQFSQAIALGGASYTLTIKDRSGLEADRVLSFNSSHVSGASLTVPLPSSQALASGRVYSIRMPADSLRSLLGVSFAGLLTDTQWTFTTAGGAGPALSSVSPRATTVAPGTTCLKATFDQVVAQGASTIHVNLTDHTLLSTSLSRTFAVGQQSTSVLFVDNFTRADGPLGSNYSVPPGGVDAPPSPATISNEMACATNTSYIYLAQPYGACMVQIDFDFNTSSGSGMHAYAVGLNSNDLSQPLVFAGCLSSGETPTQCVPGVRVGATIVSQGQSISFAAGVTCSVSVSFYSWEYCNVSVTCDTVTQTASSAVAVSFNTFALGVDIVPGSFTDTCVDNLSIRADTTSVRLDSSTARSLLVSAGVDPGRLYSVLMDPGVVTSLAGQPFAGLSDESLWQFSTTGGVAPVVVFSTPANGTSLVDTSAVNSITLNFDQAVVKNASASATTVVLELADLTLKHNTITVPLSSISLPTLGSASVVFSPLSLGQSAIYRVTLMASALQSLTGQGTETYVMQFSTLGTQAPMVSALQPTASSINVTVGTVPSITFNEVVFVATEGTVAEFTDLTGLHPSVTLTKLNVSISGTTVTLDDAPLNEGVLYAVTIPSGVFQNYFGVAYAGLSGSTAWSFGTENPSAPVLVSLVPSSGATQVDVANTTQLLLQFNQNTKQGSGAFTVVDNSDSSVLVVLPSAVSGWGTKTLRFPNPGMVNGKSYHVLVPNGAILSLLDVAFAGFSTSTAWSFSTRPGAPSVLLLTAAPPSVMNAGGSFDMSCQLQDAFGNVITDTGYSVAWQVLRDGTTAPAVANASTAVSAGAAAASFIVDTPGTFLVSVSLSGVTAVPSVSSSTFQVRGPPVELRFDTQPVSTVAAGVIWSTVSLSLRDASGAVVEAQGNYVSQASVTLSSTQSGGSDATLLGTVSQTVTVSSGAILLLFNFTDLQQNEAGLYRLSASASIQIPRSTSVTVLSATSDQYTIVAGQLHALTFLSSAGPNNSTAGVMLTPALICTAVDAAGNAAIVPSTHSARAVLVHSSVPGSIPNAVTEAAGLTGTTVVSFDAGSRASFADLRVTRTGSFQIQCVLLVQGSATNITALSRTFSVSSGPLAALVMRTQPGGGQSMVPWSVQPVVELQDSLGNVLAEDSSSTAVAALTTSTATASGGVLHGTTSAQSVLGVVSFTNLTVDIAGSYTLTIRVPSALSGLTITVVSESFTVLPGAPSALSVDAQPSGAAINVVWRTQPRLSIRDVGGNVVPVNGGADVTVEILSNTLNATLKGNTTLQPVAGIVQFTDLRIDSIGTYVLRVSYFAHSSGLKMTATRRAAAAPGGRKLLQISNTITPDFYVDTNNLDVSPPIAASVVFTVAPATAQAGVVLSPAPAVTVFDEAGDPYSGSAGLFCVINMLSFDASSTETVLFSGTRNQSYSTSTNRATFPDLSLADPLGTVRLVVLVYPGQVRGTADLTLQHGATAVLILLQQPAAGFPDAPWNIQPILELRDRLGHRATRDSSTIVTAVLQRGPSSVTGNDGSNSNGGTIIAPANLTGTTSVRAENGRVVFRDLGVSGPGSFTLLFMTSVPTTSGQTLSTTSGVFIVSPRPNQPFIVLPSSEEEELRSTYTTGIVVGGGTTATIAAVNAGVQTYFVGNVAPAAGMQMAHHLLLFVVWVQMLIVALEHNTMLSGVFDVFRVARVFQGNVDGNESPAVLAFAHSLVPKLIAFFGIVVMFVVLKGYRVHTCFGRFTLHASLFIPLFEIALLPIAESFMDVYGDILWHVLSVWVVLSGVLWSIWYRHVYLKWVDPKNAFFYAMMVGGRGNKALCYRPKRKKKAKKLKKVETKQGGGKMHKSSSVTTTMDSIVAEEEAFDGDEKDDESLWQSVVRQVKSWKCELAAYHPESRYVKDYEQRKRNQELKQDRKQHAKGYRRNPLWDEYHKHLRNWQAWAFRPMFEQTTVYRIKGDYHGKTHLFLLRAAVSHHFQFIKTFVMLTYLALAIYLDGRTQLTALIGVLGAYLLLNFLFMPWRNSFLQKEVLLSAVLIVQLFGLLYLLENPKDYQILWLIMGVQFLAIPLMVLLHLIFHEVDPLHNKERFIPYVDGRAKLKDLKVRDYSFNFDDFDVARDVNFSEEDKMLCMYRGIVYWNMGGRHRSDKRYTFMNMVQAARIDPKEPTPLVYLGHFYRRTRNNLKKAVTYYTQALHLNPCHTAALDHLAWIYVQQNKKEKAVQLYETALAKAKSRDIGHEQKVYIKKRYGLSEDWMPPDMEDDKDEDESSTSGEDEDDGAEMRKAKRQITIDEMARDLQRRISKSQPGTPRQTGARRVKRIAEGPEEKDGGGDDDDEDLGGELSVDDFRSLNRKPAAIARYGETEAEAEEQSRRSEHKKLSKKKRGHRSRASLSSVTGGGRKLEPSKRKVLSPHLPSALELSQLSRVQRTTTNLLRSDLPASSSQVYMTASSSQPSYTGVARSKERRRARERDRQRNKESSMQSLRGAESALALPAFEDEDGDDEDAFNQV